MAIAPQKRDVPHPELTGAATLWLFSLTGALLSTFLTVAKFRSAYRCDESLVSACGSWFDCSRVLNSPWASVLGVPISTYAASYYVVLFGLATAVLVRPARYLPIVRPVILWLAWGGLAIVAWLAAYALVVVGGLCSYCSVIYAIQLVLFLAAWLMNPGGLLAGFVALWSHLRRRGPALLLAVLGFVALTTAQMALYHRGAASMKVEPRCVVQGRSLPETALRTESAAPEVEVGLFVDLACPACREEFGSWMQDAEASGGRYQVSIYHYAREGNCVPANFPAQSPPSLKQHACTAAMAVECVARLTTERAEREPDRARRARVGADAGLAMMRRLFDMQGEAPYFTRTRVAEAAIAGGLAVTVDDRADPFMTCLDDPQVRARIVEHARFGMNQRLMETPGAFFVFYDGHVPADRMLLVKGGKVYGDVDQLMADLRAQLLGRKG